MKKVLFVIGGQWHDYVKCSKILSDAVATRSAADCTITDDWNALADLSGYDAVMVYAQGGALTESQERGLCGWVEAGGAFVGIHSAADAWVENERYMEMIGTQFDGHGPVTAFNVNISDGEHEVVRGIREFNITDEFYILKKRSDADLHWLLSGNWQSKLHPLAYTRKYGKGRVFYTALGHDARAFEHASFQKLIHRAIAWTTRSIKPGPVRFGVIGYGGAFSMGKAHADMVRDTPGLEISAVCDVDPKRVAKAKEDYPKVKTFTLVNELIASGRVDVGIIVTPHNTHASIAVELLEAGIGVVCEKPFCLSVDEATKMIETARSHRALLTTFHNRRWDADFLAIKKVIDDGLLGEVFHIEAFMGEYKHPGYWWRSDKSISGGAIYDWGAHFADWILNLMPHRMESVTGFMSTRVWHDVTNEDHCKAIIRFEGGRSAELEISNLASVGRPKFRILGTKGGLTCDWKSPINVTSFVRGVREEIAVPFVEGNWADYYQGVADHLLVGEPLPVTPESARRVIAVLELAERSSESGQAEPVPFEET